MVQRVPRLAAAALAALALTAASVPALAQQAQVDEYKKAVANRIVQANKMRLSKAGYRNVTVVGYTLDRSGAVTESWIVRSSGDRKLDDLAHTNFKRALPLPTPPASIFGSESNAHLAEAFVHTTDGGFKIQTLIQ